MNGTLVKIKNKGTEDPLIARLFFGVLKLRDYIIQEEQERLAFDQKYEPVKANLEEAQEDMLSLIEAMDSHLRKVNGEEIIRFQNGVIEVSESIDNFMNKNFKNFFIKGDISVRSLMKLAQHLGFDISFFLRKDKDFEKGAKLFLEKYPEKKYVEFIKMLESDRKSWYATFDLIRNKIEHEGLSLPNTKYIKDKEKVVVIFPTINGESLEELLKAFWENLFEFIEDVTVNLISFKLTPPFMIRMIPEESRDKSFPLKYDIWAEGLTEFLEKESKKEVNYLSEKSHA